MTRYWLLKTEPNVFSFADLLAAPKKTTHWEGVRNYQARNSMRDDMRVGDQVLFYHSSCEVPAIMGIAEVSREAYPDPKAMDLKSEYCDEKAIKRKVNPWVMVDVKAVRSCREPLTLEKLRKTPGLEKMLLLQRGQRLSVQAVTEAEWRVIELLM